MSNESMCPKCNSETTYEDMNMQVCAECFHEWNLVELTESADLYGEAGSVKDSNGNVLQNGDSVIVIKDLKVKGSPTGIKAGTKVKNIVLAEAHDGHDISCKVDGIGAMYLKSEFVKKV